MAHELDPKIYSIFLYGISGLRLDQFIQEFKHLALYLNPDIIIFEIGSNDLFEISVTRSSSEFVSHWLDWQTFHFAEYGVSVCVMC